MPSEFSVRFEVGLTEQPQAILVFVGGEAAGGAWATSVLYSLLPVFSVLLGSVIAHWSSERIEKRRDARNVEYNSHRARLAAVHDELTALRTAQQMLYDIQGAVSLRFYSYLDALPELAPKPPAARKRMSHVHDDLPTFRAELVMRVGAISAYVPVALLDAVRAYYETGLKPFVDWLDSERKRTLLQPVTAKDLEGSGAVRRFEKMVEEFQKLSNTFAVELANRGEELRGSTKRYAAAEAGGGVRESS